MTTEGIPITWEHFKGFVGECSQNGYSFIYRGQSNSSWTLTSTWHRLPDVPNKNLEFYWGLLRELYDAISFWSGYQWNLENPVDKGAFLSFLQHHGFPTPLLDWTKSPYIAAYFAFEGVNDSTPEKNNVSVFVFDHVTFDKHWNQVFQLQPTQPFVSVLPASPKGNFNQIVQQGIYTYSSVTDQKQHIMGLENRTDNKLGVAGTYLIQYLLPVDEKPTVMRELKMMGITAMSLFPGVDGVCKAYKQEHFAASKIGRSMEALMEDFLSAAQPRETVKGNSSKCFDAPKKSLLREKAAISTLSNK